MTDRTTNNQHVSGPPAAQPIGEITSEGTRITLRGCALQLALWIARRQSRINDAALDGGQLILNWKGVSSPSISGEIKTRL
ncbi:MAG TPA: hypothetical protein VKT52_01015 [Ktedonobacterales bacterium]|nr:hypothetical protein [Ktedonobacterales bacterium]